MTPGHGRIDHEYGHRVATTPPDDDGPVRMVILMSHRDVADDADGRESGCSGREADDLSTPREPLAAVGAEIVSVAMSTTSSSATRAAGTGWRS